MIGYGFSERAPCEVDGWGPGQYQFCGTAPGCSIGRNKTCPVLFKYERVDVKGCSYEETPAAKDGRCQRFWTNSGLHPEKARASSHGHAVLVNRPSSTNGKAKKKYRYIDDSAGFIFYILLRILQLTAGTGDYEYLTTCYSGRPGRYGWCGTVTDIRDAGYPDQAFDIQPDKGWGFCQKACSKGYKQKLMDDHQKVGIGKEEEKDRR